MNLPSPDKISDATVYSINEAEFEDNVEIFCERAASLFAGLDTEPTWQTVLALEPGSPLTLDETAFDNACEAIADFTDIKSPYFLNHSRHVADLVARTAKYCGLPTGDVQLVRRAGYLHDLGKVGIRAVSGANQTH